MLSGFFSYDIIRYIENIPNSCNDDLKLPDVRLMRPRSVIIHDNLKKKIHFIVNCYSDEKINNYKNKFDLIRNDLINLKKITSDKEKVLVIEDSKNGYESAKNAGLECLMVRNLGSLKKKLSKINDHPYQIISSKNINLKIVPFSEKISVSQKKKIEKIWTSEQKNRKKKLFNSKVLSLKSICSTSKKISISANFVDYKYIITDRHEPSIGLKLKQIGTSGLILIDDKKDEYTLFAKRSKNNTEYPNYFELVPSGNLDDFSKINSGNLDYKSKLLDELEEEMNIKKNQVKKIFEICVIKDKNNSVYDICCIIKLGTNKNRIMRNLRNTVEYTEPKFVKIKDTPRFIVRNYDKIVPTSLGLLEHYLKRN